jgi:prepilin-type N-terminal cleavage/methylation domain-containing protein
MQKGFTIVELSISLVIIGMLVGGTVSSIDLIKNAKLKLIIKDAQEYQIAYSRFKEKFKYPPGDFPGGGRYWGTDCAGTVGGTDLCSGEGDFKIEDGANDALIGTSETFLAWKHLEKAQLITATYTGLKGTGTNCSGLDKCAVIGRNIPKSKWKEDVGVLMLSGTSDTGLFFGKQISNDHNTASSMSPKDAQSLDVKIDDGDPIAGYFRASFITGVTITNSATCLNAATTYNLTNTAEDCGAVFVLSK